MDQSVDEPLEDGGGCKSGHRLNQSVCISRAIRVLLFGPETVL